MPKPNSNKKKATTQVSSVSTPKGISSAQVAPIPASDDGPPIKFPKLKITECSTAADPAEGGRGPLMPEEWKVLLGWETESQYQNRMVAENGGKAEQYQYKDDYHCMNMKGEKVRCRNNSNNRPFDMNWCKALLFTTLQGLWAGPHTIPGETVNGETVRIGRHGIVLSGQHQGTAAILADEVLLMERGRADYDPVHPRFPFWNGHEHPFIETIVVTGLSEDERVLRTIDYVKPRTAADMLYTMPLFRDNTAPERREMTRMLASAVDMLWERTRAKGYRTHPEIVGFLERHTRLLEMVSHLFIENSAKGADGGRRISKLRLSPGECAAMAYLMACSGNREWTDEELEEYAEKYHREVPPNEKGLDWSMWDKASEFWTRLSGGRTFTPVRAALGRLIDSTPDSEDNQGLGGRAGEKLAILSKAWKVWAEHPGINGDDGDAGPPFTTVHNQDGTYSYPDLKEGGSLHLSYTDISAPKITKSGKFIPGERMPNGQVRLEDMHTADFGGIDCPKVSGTDTDAVEDPPEKPSVSPIPREEIEAGMQAAAARREEHARKLMENRAAGRKE